MIDHLGFDVARDQLARHRVARMEQDRDAARGQRVGQRIDVAVGQLDVEDGAIGMVAVELFERFAAVGVRPGEGIAFVADGFGKIVGDDELVFHYQDGGPLHGGGTPCKADRTLVSRPAAQRLPGECER